MNGVVSNITVESQQAVLYKLAEMTARSCVTRDVREAAIALTMDCVARSDLCELQAIYGAVKDGDPRVAGLERGVRYVADPLLRDWFIAPHRMLQMCARGACAEDCDSQAALVAALASAIGFPAGLRAWGKLGGRTYQHVYAVVLTPKKPKPGERPRVISLDTTVPDARVGWAPPRGRVYTAWIHRKNFKLAPSEYIED